MLSELQDSLASSRTMIHYLKGDATRPVKLPAMIPHIVNDLGAWGAGFVIAITKRFGPGPEYSYRLWAQSKEDFRLGKIQIVNVYNNIHVVNMIAQSGLISCVLNKSIKL